MPLDNNVILCVFYICYLGLFYLFIKSDYVFSLEIEGYFNYPKLLYLMIFSHPYYSLVLLK